ncbi:cytochrome P450 [Calycina marina]|uniref:Cytochrome P450 n=1 Tax=Calycina marina TaxID=1763456 RepID=A0A9P7Z2T4_9HELO|nr:cytochrome P450 [Calycina marina]
MGCGTFRSYGLGEPSDLMTADPQNIQAILANKYNDFGFGTERVDIVELSLAASTRTAEDEKFATAMGFAQDYVTWRIHLGNSGGSSGPSNSMKCPVIDKFILLDALVAETRDSVKLCDQILHILLAGRDTASSMLSGIILLLSRHPEEYQKFRGAIVNAFGTETKPTQELTFSSLKSCKELTHVFHEVLMLYPLVSLNARPVVRDTYLPMGAGANPK